MAFFGLVLVATEASHLVQYFTRFTEEGFCALISLIFIYDSLKKMLSLAEAFPINWHYRTDDVTLYSCSCNLSSPGEPRLPWLCSWGCTCTGTSWLVAQPQPGSLNVFCWSPPACPRAGTREGMKVSTARPRHHRAQPCLVQGLGLAPRSAVVPKEDEGCLAHPHPASLAALGISQRDMGAAFLTLVTAPLTLSHARDPC